MTPTPPAGPPPPRHEPCRLVSVVMPVRDAAETLPAALEALTTQTYTGDWEVVVADNGSRDPGAAIAAGFVDRLPLRVVDAGARSGISAARNLGREEARGELLVFCDADDQVTPGWLAAMVDAATVAEVVGGRLETAALNDPLHRSWRGEPQPPHSLARALNHLPYATGASLAVWTEVFDQLDGFDESLPFGGDDIDFCWRAQQAGHRLGLAEAAVTSYRYRTSLRAACRQAYRYGIADTYLYTRFRSDLAPPRPKHLAAAYLRLLLAGTACLRSAGDRGAWLTRVANRAGRLVGSVRNRVVYP